MKLIPLQEQYNQYLKQYKRTKKRNHPHPSELLALLLLPDKDRYKYEGITIGQFYNVYKDLINVKIEQVINDFELTEEDIISYAIKDPRLKVDYERLKIRYTFSLGYGILETAYWHHPDWSPEEVHNAYLVWWGKTPVPEHLIEGVSKKNDRKKKTRKISINTRGFK